MTCEVGELRRCLECGTIFEVGVADCDLSDRPRCPQCFLTSTEPYVAKDPRDIVIRTTTPFR